MKYNSKVKAHITEMAIRKAFLSKFEKMMDDVSVEMTVEAESLGDHTELSALPKHLHDNFNGCQTVRVFGCKLLKVNNYTALCTSESIFNIQLKNGVFISQVLMNEYVGNSRDNKNGSIFNIQSFLDNDVDKFALDVRISLDSYKTYKQAVESLPWIKGMHPDKDINLTGCNLVPVDTINKVNDLMNSFEGK